MVRLMDHDGRDTALGALSDRSADVARRPDEPAVAEALAAHVFSLHADVTPEELRNTELRESFRGYHRAEVDTLCERAAETIERLQRQRRLLEERLAAGRDASPSSVERTPRSQSALLRPSAEAAREIDVIQRTLLLAQHEADHALADAQERARALTGEAQAKAQALVTDAETAARRIADEERRRLETEIASLGATRDALTADVDMLEHFAASYRDRLRRAIEDELARIERSAVAEIDVPPPPGIDAPAASPGPDAPPAPGFDAAVVTAIGPGDEENHGFDAFPQ